MALQDAQVYFRDVDIAAHSIIRWAKGREAEPVHGLFLRIAALNHQTSTRSYAEALGIQGRYLQPVECRAILAKVPIANWADVDRWTPVFKGRTVTIAGQTMSAQHWTMRGRRFCPGCLAESAHHRTWWDLMFLHRCPFHDQDLIAHDRLGNEVGWWYPSIDMAPSGERLSRDGIPRIDDPGDTWEAYALGRMGLARPRSLPGVDLPDPAWPTSGTSFSTLDMDVVLDLVGLLGRLAIAGWSRTAPSVGSGKVVSSDVLDAGFSCAAGGQAEVDRLFARVVSLAPTDALSSKDLLGWVIDWLQADERRRTDLVMRAIVRTLRVDGRWCSAFADMFPDIEGRIVSVADVSRALDVAPSTSRRILIQAGLLDVSKDSRRARIRRRADDARAVAALVDDMRMNCLTKAEVSEMLGVDVAAVTRLVAGGHLVDTGRKWAADGSRTPGVRRDSVERLLEATVSGTRTVDGKGLMPLLDAAASVNVDVVDVVSGLLSRRIKVAGRLDGRAGLSSLLAAPSGVPLDHPLMFALRHPHGTRVEDRIGGVTRAEAASALGVPIGTIAGLLLAGYLKPVPGTREGQRQPLTSESLADVIGDLVTAAACVKAHRFAGSPSALSVVLRKAGVRDVLEDARRTSQRRMTAFYPRGDAMEALARHDCSLTEGDPVREAKARLMGDFWAGFDAFLRSAQSAFRVRSSTVLSARLRTNCARWRSEISFEEGVLRCRVIIGEHDTAGRGEAATNVWRERFGGGTHLRRPPIHSGRGSLGFEVGPIASMSGRDEVLFGTFRPFLYRQMLLGIEEGRIFFEHAENGSPGRRPFVMF